MKNYENIHYTNCPHFTVGCVDQWAEQGFLFHEGKVFCYHEDRKEQYGATYHPKEIADFLTYAQKNEIEIPPNFLATLKDYEKNNS